MPEQLTSTPLAERAGYVARFNSVVDYSDAHLAEPLDLHTLATVAHFSPWHFHRLFQAMMGETLAERVRRRRLEAAASLLLASPPAPVQAVALDTGFGSPEVFTRTFKSHFGVTPSAWRQGAHRSWASARRTQLRKIHHGNRKPYQGLYQPSLHPARSMFPANRCIAARTSFEVGTKGCWSSTRTRYAPNFAWRGGGSASL